MKTLIRHLGDNHNNRVAENLYYFLCFLDNENYIRVLKRYSKKNKNMKKIILLALIILIIAGCDDYRNPNGSYDTSRSISLETIVIDSCEYINGYSRLAHKGNCRFCKERRQEEFEQLKEK